MILEKARSKSRFFRSENPIIDLPKLKSSVSHTIKQSSLNRSYSASNDDDSKIYFITPISKRSKIHTTSQSNTLCKLLDSFKSTCMTPTKERFIVLFKQQSFGIVVTLKRAAFHWDHFPLLFDGFRSKYSAEKNGIWTKHSGKECIIIWNRQFSSLAGNGRNSTHLHFHDSSIKEKTTSLSLLKFRLYNCG